ncbi:MULTISPECIES: VOC family protein [unclassified Variovorax]|uniref:VOC family protein n=1 Tax=unclassified Variovorax TaxID=663243 RepID=UPI001BD64D88|nr:MULTISPECIES: VOC family protein [unclassified Variovorax]
MTEPHLHRRAGVVAVHSLNRFVFSVPDLDEAERFYLAFGLDVRRIADRIDLHTWGHPHAWGSVFESGAAKRLEYLSYGIDEADLPAWRERIDRHGIAGPAHRLSKGGGLWLRNPDGTPLQLVVAPKVSPSEKSQATARSDAAPGQGAAPTRSVVRQVRPRHLSHALFFTPDVQRMVEFSSRVLGLRMSDHSGDVIAFMHGPHGSDHHLVAFAKSHAPGLHHSSWDVGSIDEVGSGAEQMRAAGHDQGWGVGRHVLGSNYFHYVRDPWGSFAEYSHDIDFVPHDLEWPAADHPPHDSLYVWGPPVPGDFITNHEPVPGAPS